MVNTSHIKPHMPVVCSEGGQFATVDHMESDGMIKLSRDKSGQHHYIPTAWVTSIDDKLHVDRPGDQAMREWSTSPTMPDRSKEDPTFTERVRSQQAPKADPELDPQRAARLRH
ncbi:MAG TPA: DUF2171 domain-containing protein [Polyangiaceae bacterium]|jgi:hypothetical protein|nr:DUF2171 domain-containing protein [Polyangiaceae bacterium]